MGCSSSKPKAHPPSPTISYPSKFGPLTPAPEISRNSQEDYAPSLDSIDIFDTSPVLDDETPHLFQMMDGSPLSCLESDQFHIMYELAGGSNGVIFCGQRLCDETPVAFKFFGYTDHEPSLSNIKAEIELMMSYTHLEALPKIFGYFLDTPTGLVADKVYHKPYPVIVMELLDGVDLFEASYHRHLLASERRLSSLFHQIFTALQSLHDHRLIHRDLKLENLMIVNPPDHLLHEDEDLVGTDLDPELGLRTQKLKIIDYGSMVLLPTSRSGSTVAKLIYHDHTLVGTPGYLAPESFTYLDYSFQSDIWQVGCCLFSLLSGTAPFPSQGNQLSPSFRHAPMTGPAWTSVSVEAKDLVQKLLRRNPTSRPTIREILQHPWMSAPASCDNKPFGESYFSRVKYLALRQKMRHFFLDTKILEKGRDRRRKLKKIIPLLRQMSSSSGQASIASNSPKGKGEGDGVSDTHFDLQPPPHTDFSSASPPALTRSLSRPVAVPLNLAMEGISPETLQERLQNFKSVVLQSLQSTGEEVPDSLTPHAFSMHLPSPPPNSLDALNDHSSRSLLSTPRTPTATAPAVMKFLDFDTFCRLMTESDLPALASHRVFRIFDLDGRGEINIKDFLLTMAAFYPSQSHHGSFRSHWNYEDFQPSSGRSLVGGRDPSPSSSVGSLCSSSSPVDPNEEEFLESIARYYFDIFDLNNCGFIDLNQLKRSVGCFIDYEVDSPLNRRRNSQSGNSLLSHLHQHTFSSQQMDDEPSSTSPLFLSEEDFPPPSALHRQVPPTPSSPATAAAAQAELPPDMDLEPLFRLIDTDRRGFINFEQFLKYFKSLRRNLR
jgi:serine/threonine protein kinase/Ca2+-binding EF-hand superfamily protein